ncbi:Pilin (type 1 fimbria component protein) [Izhakiella capsodis]|uniref:Pilin (Type 1 fimbria component protein) n=1 Tax=Izhakiella capsodis TaxID=1367852 RepID=A0A1I4XG25_9GAMM|nr:fimbrial protein [Izhakiella capsodis]SFN24433.1 Pilin (type 1 fimbria component protein) [Izhakiella capsodis]
MNERMHPFFVDIPSRRNLLRRLLWGKSGLLLSLALAAGMVSAQGQAAVCAPIGGTKNYNFELNYTLTNPSENTTGRVIKRASASDWNLGGVYNVTCFCQDTYQKGFVTAKVPDTEQVYKDGPLNFYSVNEFLAVASEVFIAGNLDSYVATPFFSVSNRNNGSSRCETAPYGTGASGFISLYFKRPFVGKQTIPLTKVVDVYIASDEETQSPTPVSTVWMSGTVVVPQSCEINGGGVITVPFGDIMSGDIATKGEMAKNFTPKNVNLNVACTNISEGVKLSLSFQGTPDINDPTLLSSTNTDIGVRIQDTAGATIAPQSGRLPLMMDYASQSAVSGIKLFPVNTTGHVPETGDFTATATIRAEIE